jgi:hypothetical protein
MKKNVSNGLKDLRAFGQNGVNSEEAVAARAERSQRTRVAKTPGRKCKDGRNLVGRHGSRVVAR